MPKCFVAQVPREVVGGLGWTENGQGLHLEPLAAPLSSVSVESGSTGPTALLCTSFIAGLKGKHRTAWQRWVSILFHPRRKSVKQTL